MQDTLQNHKSTISVCGREISNRIRFADYIYIVAGSNDDLQELTNRLVETSK